MCTLISSFFAVEVSYYLIEKMGLYIIFSKCLVDNEKLNGLRVYSVYRELLGIAKLTTNKKACRY